MMRRTCARSIYRLRGRCRVSERRQPGSYGAAGTVFVASIFASAFLLFMIQPVLARMLLPRFGGTPGVWNTSVVFFQSVLLLGYVYAHWGLRLLGARRFSAVHAVVLVSSLLLLPPTLATAAPPIASDWPVAELLASLSVTAAIPFFVLSTNSSLVQHWFAIGRRHREHDPYRLYAASNAGSLLALVGYPFVIEPVWRISDQVWIWSFGYGLFVATTIALMLMVRSASSGDDEVNDEVDSGRSHVTVDGEPDGVAGRPLSWVRRLLWLVRAAVAVSLLLSVTVVITTDIAPVPLLWVIPLAIYLLTFILAFASPRFYPQRLVVVGSIACVVVSLSTALLAIPIPLAVTLPLALLTLFFGALLCHGDMALDRPEPSYLTEYYLWVALGGVVGGILNGIVAPVVFDRVAEYPLTLLALSIMPFLGPGEVAKRLRAWRPGSLSFVMPIFLVALAVWAVLVPDDGSFNTRLSALIVPQFILVAGLVSLGFRRTWSYLLSIVVAALFVAGGISDTATVIHEARSFFGVQRVLAKGDTRTLMHGSTMHGIQEQTAERRNIPGSYYHPNSPLGTLINEADADASIGIIGLGAGSLAALSKAGQTFVFHEIDPLVVQIAEDYFTFLEDSPADVDIVMGDGRLTLADVPDGTYDILIVDAFSSDSVPTHLLTVEAFQLYRSKVRESGVIMIHLSNRHIDIARIAHGVAGAAGLHGATHEYSPTAQDWREWAQPTHVAVLSPSAETIDALAEAHGWTPLDPNAPSTIWTDDYAPLLGVLRWQQSE